MSPVSNPIPDEKLLRAGMRGVGKSFYGEIWENAARVPMGRGYANDDQPFDIETAAYLKPVFRAIKDPAIPVVCCLAAVQMLKTFACVEESVAYFLEHDPGDTTIYIGGDDSARDQARARIIPRFKAIPGVAAQIAAAEAQSRFDVTTQEFYLPGQVLRIWGLNESTTQRITLRRVIISDAFLSKKTGLMGQAIARTTQHRHDRKVLVESQGGEVGDDMDEFWKTTNMQYLHVVCPYCAQGQPFDFHRERPDDFKATLPIADCRLPIADQETLRSELSARLRAEDRKHCGFKRGPEELIKREDGSYIESEVIKQTYYECYHCGTAWQDTPEMRKQLDASSYYVPSNPRALPGYVGFSWPSWAGQRLPWGGEEVMLGYLRAKQTHEKRGNVEPLKQWWQKRAAKPWDENLIKALRKRNQDAYDVEMAKHDAWRLLMIIDNQKDLTQQWVSVMAVKQNGGVRQLWRGSLNGLAECRKKQLEFGLDAKGKPLLKDQYVFLDGRYKPEQICRHIVEHKYGHWATVNGERVWLGWNLMQGGRYEYYTHADEKDKTKKFIVGDPNWREYRVDGNYVEILIFPFSATSTGQRFEASRDGLGAETLFLEQLPGEPPDDHELSHHAQIHSNKLVESKSFEPRAAKQHYVPVPPSAPDHYFHIWRMTEAVKEIWQIDGVYRESEVQGLKSKV